MRPYCDRRAVKQAQQRSKTPNRCDAVTRLETVAAGCVFSLLAEVARTRRRLNLALAVLRRQLVPRSPKVSF